jgi:hypothetical protein
MRTDSRKFSKIPAIIPIPKPSSHAATLQICDNSIIRKKTVKNTFQDKETKNIFNAEVDRMAIKKFNKNIKKHERR